MLVSSHLALNHPRGLCGGDGILLLNLQDFSIKFYISFSSVCYS